MSPDEEQRQYQKTIDRRIDAVTTGLQFVDARTRRTDERIGAIAKSVELLTHDVQSLRASIAGQAENSKRDAESIRALARIAEIHERRLTSIEGGQQA